MIDPLRMPPVNVDHVGHDLPRPGAAGTGRGSYDPARETRSQHCRPSPDAVAEHDSSAGRNPEIGSPGTCIHAVTLTSKIEKNLSSLLTAQKCRSTLMGRCEGLS